MPYLNNQALPLNAESHIIIKKMLMDRLVSGYQINQEAINDLFGGIFINEEEVVSFFKYDDANFIRSAWYNLINPDAYKTVYGFFGPDDFQALLSHKMKGLAAQEYPMPEIDPIIEDVGNINQGLEELNEALMFMQMNEGLEPDLGNVADIETTTLPRILKGHITNYEGEEEGFNIVQRQIYFLSILQSLSEFGVRPEFIFLVNEGELIKTMITTVSLELLENFHEAIQQLLEEYQVFGLPSDSRVIGVLLSETLPNLEDEERAHRLLSVVFQHYIKPSWHEDFFRSLKEDEAMAHFVNIADDGDEESIEKIGNILAGLERLKNYCAPESVLQIEELIVDISQAYLEPEIPGGALALNEALQVAPEDRAHHH